MNGDKESSAFPFHPHPHPHPQVRAAFVDDEVFIFHAGTGRYFTLVGGAARAWSILEDGKRELEREITFDAYCTLFGKAELLDCEYGQAESHLDASLAVEIYEHLEYRQLILGQSEIDLPLHGAFGEVLLEDPSQRRLMNRIRVKSFVNSFEDEAQAVAESGTMLTFGIHIGSNHVRISVPQADASSTMPISRSFINQEEVRDAAKTDFQITFFDDSVLKRETKTHFDEDWHLPLGTLDEYVTGASRVAVDRHTQTVSALSEVSRRCSVWTRDFMNLPYWYRATPLRLQLSWIADRAGLEFLHAAAVNVGGEALLFAGPSGSGKSTIALILAGQGLPLIADDFLIASQESVQGLYRRSKVHDHHLAQTIGASWRVVNSGVANQKRIVEPLFLLDGEIRPIRAIVVPTISDVTSIEAMRPREALSAIAPASISGLLGGNRSSVERIAHLVKRYPCFRLCISAEVFEDPTVLLKLVGEIA